MKIKLFDSDSLIAHKKYFFSNLDVSKKKKINFKLPESHSKPRDPNKEVWGETTNRLSFVVISLKVPRRWMASFQLTKNLSLHLIVLFNEMRRICVRKEN